MFQGIFLCLQMVAFSEESPDRGTLRLVAHSTHPYTYLISTLG